MGSAEGFEPLSMTHAVSGRRKQRRGPLIWDVEPSLDGRLTTCSHWPRRSEALSCYRPQDHSTWGGSEGVYLERE